MLFEIRNGTVSRGGETVLSHFDFAIRGTEKLAIVGRNGAGKSTLLKLITGELDLDLDYKDPSAKILRSRKFTVGALNQTAVADPGKTVEETILEGFDEELPLKGEAGGEKETSGLSVYSRERYDFEQRYDRIFTGFGFSLEDKSKKLGTFSGGEQTKIMLIRLLLMEPDVLVLDEPTNHLDTEATAWLEAYLKSYPKAVVAVSHDRYFIDETAEAVIEVSSGKLVRYAGNYTSFRKEKLARIEKQRKAYEEQQEEIRRLDELIRRFKNKPRKASFARSRTKILERMEMIGKPDPDDAVIHTGEILPAKPGSKWVLTTEKLMIGYRKEKPLRTLSFRIRRGAKIGVLGPNGTGKSTFLKTIAGVLPSIGGKLQIGENVDLAYYDQFSSEIQSDKRVIDWFLDRFPSLLPEDARKFLAGFLFRGEDLGKTVTSLSGGEKARLVLSSIFQSKPNFLILDEPTNNMDIPAKETLESIFRDYKGTILVVSHDRYFLSRVVDSLLVFEAGTQEILFYPNDYRHYAERMKRVKDGSSADLTRTAEEQRLIEGLRSVPKAEKGMLRTVPDVEQEFDWRFDLNRTEREKAEERFRIASMELLESENEYPETEEDYIRYEAWREERQQRRERLRAETEKTREAWTEQLLSWFDLYEEREEYRNSLRKD